MSVLYELANRLGILTSFWDGGLVSKEYKSSDETIRFIANVLGYRAKNDEQVLKSIEKFDNQRFEKTLESCIVRKNYDVYFDVVVLEKEYTKDIEVFVIDAKNERKKVDIKVSEVVETKNKYARFYINFSDILEIGYYDLFLQIGKKKYKSRLALAPKQCFEKQIDEKIWGFALQLYSLKSKQNWGVGDFTDLANFINISAKNGADLIGLNPLNVLSHDYPENASPYQSISRLFLNPIYIDVSNLPEYEKNDEKEVVKEIQKARNSKTILYEVVYKAKIKVLEKLYEKFLLKADKNRNKEFDDFCKKQGFELERLAIFQTLYEEKTKTIWGGWKSWEKEYKNPNSPEVLKYASEHKKRVGFFKFLQFEADRQLKIVYDVVVESKMKIGLYRDLAVGVGQDSAEFWSDDSDVFIKDVGAGAPPDAFFSAGQKWGLGAFNPFRLKELGYEPLIKVLRANMSLAGALRIDHVMWLSRLYLIAEKNDGGTYLHYNFDDMLNIVAIESHLNQCIIVGESIGNVPNGFMEKIQEANIKSLSILWAERYDSGWGEFRQPEAYPEEAYVSIGTHDMAPLKMWWLGDDIKVSYELGLIPSIDERDSNYKKRENDRIKLLGALDFANVWSKDNLRSDDYIYGQGYPEGLEEALNRFMKMVKSKVFLSSLEDILQAQEMQNLPGTDRDKHPNWRRKQSVDLEDLEDNILFIRNMKAINNA